MKLCLLLKHLSGFKIFGSDSINISSVHDDSRKVKKGGLFVAIKGLTVDGHVFIEKAIDSGAVVIVGEEEPDKKWLRKVTYVKVENSRKALGFIASEWYRNPSFEMKVIGVTGTDGKTTTANLIYQILKRAGKRAGLVSTINAVIGEKAYDTGLHITNPEPLLLHKFLAEMKKHDCEYAVLEVTSHGLDQERVAGINFDTAVLTNITHEHLDYHGSWDRYYKSKLKLFKGASNLVLNKDDKSFGKITKTVKPLSKTLSYSIEGKADYYTKNIRFRPGVTKFVVIYKDNKFGITTSLSGLYNVSNILAAVATAHLYGIKKRIIVKAIASLSSLPGRLEEIMNKRDIRIIVDFAHTPNSLEHVLSSLKTQTKGKLIAVFGCAGERDVKKRKKMGNISTTIADISIFTAEDPRSEDVNVIIEQMIEGALISGAKKASTSSLSDIYYLSGSNIYTKIPERGEAISFAINKIAVRGDTVVICGKGHEKSMAYGGVEYPWSDKDAVEAALNGRIKRIVKE